MGSQSVLSGQAGGPSRSDDAYSERSFLNGHPDLSVAQLENFCEYKKNLVGVTAVL